MSIRYLVQTFLTQLYVVVEKYLNNEMVNVWISEMERSIANAIWFYSHSNEINMGEELI